MRAAAIAAVLAFATAVAGCHGGPGRKDELSYGQVQSIHAGLTADQVLDAFGPPSRMERGPDGHVRVMDYAALDGRQERARLVLGFDERGVLVDKRFTGVVAKPKP